MPLHPGRCLFLACLLMVPAGALRAEPPLPSDERLALMEEAAAPLDGVWTGEFRQFDPGRFMGYPMRMEVTSRTEPDGRVRIEGTLHWPTLRDGVTSLSGSRRGNMLRFTEPELLQGSELVLLGDYQASFRTPDRIEGVWVHPDRNARDGFGTFVLERSSLARTWQVQEPGWLEAPGR